MSYHAAKERADMERARKLKEDRAELGLIQGAEDPIAWARNQRRNPPPPPAPPPIDWQYRGARKPRAEVPPMSERPSFAEEWLGHPVGKRDYALIRAMLSIGFLAGAATVLLAVLLAVFLT
jgi:hypothetical protein